MLAENVSRDNGAEGVLRVMLICSPPRAIAKEVQPQRGGGIHRSVRRSQLPPDRDGIFFETPRGLNNVTCIAQHELKLCLPDGSSIPASASPRQDGNRVCPVQPVVQVGSFTSTSG
jgi:hypothetical protein